MFLDTTGLANKAKKKKVIKGHFLGLWWVSPLVALINKEPLDSGPPSHGSQQKAGIPRVSWAHSTELNQNKALVGFRVKKVFWLDFGVTTTFLVCSHDVLNVFFKFSCVPQDVPNDTTFHPIPFTKILHL